MAIRQLLIRISCLLAIALSVYYLTWRALDTFNPHALALSIALYAAECYGLVTFLLHVFMVWDPRSLERRLGLTGQQKVADAVLPAPGQTTVDVFIPTYNESVALLRKTALAARELRLPHKTWVLDDGRRGEVREMCEELGVGYLTRPTNEHAKAGNLNAALARTDGELILVLDADFIARPELLERTLPHFEDERLAFVQLPQAFYNLDSIQHLAGGDIHSAWHEQSLFYDLIQPGKNRCNSAFWCGCPAVVRRTALESVGGAATSTITEDILTSMRLHATGWKSLYHNEILAVGVAPGDLDGFRTQRLRWAQGSMQILRSRENPLWKRGLTLPQRLSYFTSMTTYFQALQLAVFVSMPALILATGQSPIGHVGLSFFARFVPYVASMLLAIKLTGGSRQRLGWDLYFSFLRMFIFLRALPTIVSGGRGLRFRVTPKASSGSTHRRGLYPHLAAALVNFAVIGALLVAPLPDHLGSATKTVAYVSAGIIAAVFTFALIRLWRRVYPRRDYRVALTLPTSIAVDGGPVTTGSTTDLSFGGAALTSPRALAPGTAISLRLLGEEPLTLPGTVVSCIETTGGLHRLGVSFGPAPLEAEKRLLQIILDAVTGTRQGDQREPAIDALPLATPVPRLALTGAEA